MCLWRSCHTPRQAAVCSSSSKLHVAACHFCQISSWASVSPTSRLTGGSQTAYKQAYGRCTAVALLSSFLQVRAGICPFNFSRQLIMPLLRMHMCQCFYRPDG
jgi:hypothetical protein